MQGKTIDFISVIIPVYNDPQGLKDTLESVSVQEYPTGCFEIIIADNGSNDDTINIAEDFCKRFPGLIKVVIEDKIKSSYAARNKGIEESKGTVIAFIDADMTVEKDWLKKINKLMCGGQIDYMGCKITTYLENRSVSSYYSCINGFQIETFLKESHFTPTCCLTARKDLFDRIGMFDPRVFSCGDNEFGRRSYENGAKQYYAKEITMYHPARKTLKETVLRSFRLGRGNYLKFFYYPYRCSYKYFLVFNPLIYFPKKPWNFVKSFKLNKYWSELSVIKKIFIYLTQWINDIAVITGFSYEKFIIKKKFYNKL